jgi:hypothetical protein
MESTPHLKSDPRTCYTAPSPDLRQGLQVSPALRMVKSPPTARALHVLNKSGRRYRITTESMTRVRSDPETEIHLLSFGPHSSRKVKHTCAHPLVQVDSRRHIQSHACCPMPIDLSYPACVCIPRRTRHFSPSSHTCLMPPITLPLTFSQSMLASSSSSTSPQTTTLSPRMR